MPTPADLVLLTLILVGYPLWDYYVSWPKSKARLESGDPDARTRLYRGAMLMQWSATALIVALWGWRLRSPELLWLRMPTTGWPLAIALIVAVVATAFMLVQAIGVGRASDETRTALRPRLGYATPILPRTRTERRWFMALSITAGICEELIYRGFVVWALEPFFGLWFAALGSVIGFGVAHAYLGKQGVLRATLAGAVFAGVVLAVGSLVPGMFLHAIIDMGAGAVGYALLRDTPSTSALPA
jgi:membrane protease YdiL (CAAX protease family)